MIKYNMFTGQKTELILLRCNFSQSWSVHWIIAFQSKSQKTLFKLKSWFQNSYRIALCLKQLKVFLKKSKIGALTLPDVSTYKATAFKTEKHCYLDKEFDQLK